jgi:hypothetical protein
MKPFIPVGLKKEITGELFGVFLKSAAKTGEYKLEQTKNIIRTGIFEK